MSKSTIVYSDGEQYEELYHGGWGLGYGIENPAAADDHRSIFLVDKLPVAKSYTDMYPREDAVEFDPRIFRP